jgi:hypothetical protein
MWNAGKETWNLCVEQRQKIAATLVDGSVALLAGLVVTEV